MSTTSISFILSSSFIILFLYLDYFLKFQSTFSDLILIVVSIYWTYSLTKIYLEIFNSVNIFYVFNKHLTLIKSTNSNIEKLLSSQKSSSERFHNDIILPKKIKNTLWISVDNFRKRKLLSKFKLIDIYVQITSQILLSKIKYNLPKDFSENLMKLVRELDEFIKITTKSNLQHITSLNLLEDFAQVYYSILRNIELLIEYSSKNGKSKDLETLITFFNSSTIGPYEFTEIFNSAYLTTERVDSEKFQATLQSTQYSYIQSIKSITFILSNNGYWDEILLLRNLKNVSNEAESTTGGSFTSSEVFTLYTAFLIESINKNDVKLLTHTVNLILENKSNSIESIIKIFILCSTKAIELGHYKCAGHLIKMAVLNSGESTLESSVKDIHKKLIPKNSFNGQEFIEVCANLDKKLIADFMINMQFSSISFEYCFSKLVFMLSLQQRFKLENPHPTLNYEDFSFLTSKQYMIDKVIDLHKEYGLVSLKKTNIKKLEAVTS